MRYDNLAISLGIQGSIHGDELRARCPLHRDTHPSFSLNLVSGMYFCHSKCGGGSFDKLVQNALGCSYQEAQDFITSNGQRFSLESVISATNQVMTKLFQQSWLAPSDIATKESTLWQEHYRSLNNNSMPQWFTDRGFSWNTINHWDLRYDPVFDSVVIPVKWGGELIGTVTRHTHPSMPKYQNSDNLPKSDILFGEFSSSKPEIILSEGVLDVIWQWQLGYNAAGILGTYLSDAQVKILNRYRFGTVTLALDNDEPGKRGTTAALKCLTRNGYLLPQIKIIDFPNGIKDSQDCSPHLLAELYQNRRGILPNDFTS